MQIKPSYNNVILDIYDFFENQIKKFKSDKYKNKIILDPGIGFGKRLEDNFLIARSLNRFKELGAPVMLGASRKACTGALDGKPPADRLPGSLAFIAMAQQGGADWVRVHDVDETVRFLAVLEAIQQTTADLEART